jgi:hypothetical protein
MRTRGPDHFTITKRSVCIGPPVGAKRTVQHVGGGVVSIEGPDGKSQLDPGRTATVTEPETYAQAEDSAHVICSDAVA